MSTTRTRTRITMAVLAAATAISVPAAIIGGVAAHRAADRATIAAAELDQERADRTVDFEASEVLLSNEGLRRTVWPDFDAERWVWDGVGGADPADTTPHQVPDARFLTEHRCPAGQEVSPEDLDQLKQVTTAEWVTTDPRSIVLPRVIDVIGVRCVPAE